MKFREIRGIRVNYEQQGLIFFTLATYRWQPRSVRDQIDKKIEMVAKGDRVYIQAMRDWLINGVGWSEITNRGGVVAGTLVRYRKRLYEGW